MQTFKVSRFKTSLVLIVFLTFLFSTWVFKDSLTSYFSQDDFFHLRTVMDKTVMDIPTMMLPFYSQEQTFYRPLSREIYNFVALNTFNINPVPYHVVNFLLILINGLLLLTLILSLTKKIQLSILTYFIYSFSAIHSIELYYLASVQTLLVTFFSLIGLICYLKFINNHQIKYWYLSVLTYLLAVLSHESSVIFPLFILGIHLFYKKAGMGRMLLNISPFILITMFRVAIYLLTPGLPSQEVYHPSFNPINVMNSFIWFALWSFGLPEMLVDFVTLRLKINPNLFMWYGEYIWIVLILLGTVLGSLIILCAVFFKKIIRDKRLILMIAFYVVSLSPFIFFPQHKFVYYLTLPLIWFSTIIGIILDYGWENNYKYKVLVVISLIGYVLISYQTVNLNKITYWAAKRAAAAQYLVSDIKVVIPNAQQGAVFYIKNDHNYPNISKEWGSSAKQAFYITSGADAFKLIYHDPTIKVYFEGVNDQLIGEDKTKFINYVAKFPY